MPLPASVRDAVSYAAECGGGDQEDFMPRNLLIDTRLGGQPDRCRDAGGRAGRPDVLGLSFIAQGIDWQRGDNIIVHGDDYPSNVYPWMALEEKGVELRHLKPREPGRIDPEDVFSLIDSRTRTAALASCHYARLPDRHRHYRPRTASRGVLVCVDGIQTVGAFRLRGACRFSCRRRAQVDARPLRLRHPLRQKGNAGSTQAGGAGLA